MEKTSCWSCKSPLLSLDFGKRDSCPRCRSDTRVCLNCSFFDQSAYNACRESQAERVLDKEKANACDYFKPVLVSTASPAALPQLLLSARKKAEALFLKKS